MAFIEFGEGNGKGNRKNYTQSKFKKGKRFCPVCEKTSDWDCNITEDGGLVYCKIKESRIEQKCLLRLKLFVNNTEIFGV